MAEDNITKPLIPLARLNVIVSAFACSPYQGSEDGVGWNIVSRLGAHHEITVIYGDIGKDRRREREIKKWISENGAPPGVKFVYVPQSGVGNFFLQIAHYGKRFFPPLIFIFYYAYRCWLLKAYSIAAALHQEEVFDCAHQLTYVSYREPGYLWKLGIPFYWGPITGTVNAPWNYFKMFSAWAQMRMCFRNLVNLVQRRGNRYILNAASRAKKIWVVADEDCRNIKKYWQLNSDFIPATGTNCLITSQNSKRIKVDPGLKIVWSGILESGKALPLLLHAIARLQNQDHIQIEILGDGPEKSKWQQLSQVMQIDHLIQWRGHLPHSEAKAFMQTADILVFTSIKEGTPTVIMEALEIGLPVLCHDSCGMAPVIDSFCGVKIPMLNPEESIKGFCDAIKKFQDSPELLSELSAGAKRRSLDLTWEKNAETMARGYCM